jgi:hypothetical protein
MVLEVVEQFGRDEKILAGVFGASNVDHAGVDESVSRGSAMVSSKNRMSCYRPLVARVHALVNFVDNAERCSGQALQCHEVEYGGHGALAA